jgi:hypothetical protein
MKRFLLSLLIAFYLAPFASAGEWVNLFNGKNLDNWIQKNGIATYRIEGDAITGKTTPGSPNSFLCTKKLYGNFELEFEVKVHNQLNSGVQIRSQTKPVAKGKKEKFGRVNGPQVEIEASGAKGAEAGYVYGEATGRGWLTTKDRLKPHKVMKDGDWNKFRVVANGPKIETWINGKKIETLVDEPIFKTHPRGFIGLQVHGVGNRGPYEVSWRNIRLKEIE